MWQKMRPFPGQLKINWQIYETQEELLSAYWRDPYSMPLALVFHNEDPINGQLNYEIRTNPSFFVAPLTTELYSSPVACRETDSYWSSMIPIEMGDSCPVNQYYYSGFIALQTLLDYTKIGVSSSKLLNFEFLNNL
jgi:ATP-binding cassette, subfamily A (ABC1), member 5